MSARRQFDYEALDASGGRRQGSLNASDARHARDALLSDGMTPLKIVERSQGTRLLAGSASKVSAARNTGRTSIGDREAGDFAADLARLLHAGIALVPALTTIGEIGRTARLRAMAPAIARRVEEGASFSTALRETGGGSLGLLASLAQVGESASALGDVMGDAATTFRESAAFRDRLISLLVYPIAVAALTLTILLVFLIGVAPALRPVFAGFEDKLPLAAAILFTTSDILRAWGPYALGGALLFFGVLVATPSGRIVLRDIGEGVALSPLTLKAPAFAAYATYARALALATRRGVRLPQAHRLASETVWANRIRKGLLADVARLDSGAQLSTVLRRVPFAPKPLLHLVAAGEASGRLAPAISEAAVMLGDDARQRAERLVALAGPVITISLGGIVGLVVLTLFRALASIAEVAT